MTPIYDAYQERIAAIDSTKEFKGSDGLEVGDIIGAYNNCQTRGFVKKISKVNVLIETTYGGWGGQDCMLMELKVPIKEIRAYYKPLNN